ncbi:alpha/beta hydrolase [Flagellimonas myxillae]|uniref:alpha/beta hydrolase n=1 Tax=Flagellimonas myxillae TaxID=2942214 RepID=UPI00201EC9C8|nr:alpha/beta hydrolase [Muricauda myxillae]MCL6265197.1 alpha/beta hydrolase [Muricauda myxillae]
MVLRKGAVLNALPVNDTLPETYSLYLPSNFSTDKKWPLLVVFDLNGKESQALAMFVMAAEDEGYILAAPQVRDTASLANNMAITTRAVQKIMKLLPIHKSRIYTAGEGSGGRFANLVPTLSKDVSGAISIGSDITNTELLNIRRPFHFIGIVNKRNYNYPGLLSSEKILDRIRFPNQVLIHAEEKEWPHISYLKKSLQLLTLNAMKRKLVPKDSSYVEMAYQEDLAQANQLRNSMKLLLAEHHLSEMMGVYGAHKNLDSLRLLQRSIRRNKMFRNMKRLENASFLKESLLKEDYLYDMEEDLLTYNFNNLGWWNFQMGEINKFIEGSSKYESDMGYRLLGYINALAEDNIDIVASEELVDEGALIFLYMLKTILEPQNFNFYLKVISLSSKNEDYGTALFYLEEALKKGFADTDKLYSLEHTTLLRIDPKFNALVSKYLEDARYNIKEQ